jgi:hypothetical protein
MSRYAAASSTFICLVIFALSGCGFADQPELKGSICTPDPNIETQSCYIEPQKSNDKYVNVQSEEDINRICQSSCTKVKNLAITDMEGLENLEAFSRLQVDGSLRIVSNPVLKDFEGLEVSGKLNSLRISYNPELASIQALEGLTGIDFQVDIQWNPKLESLRGLENITNWGDVSYGGIRLYKNGLKNLEGLSGFKGNGTTLHIASEPNLRSFKGLGPVVGTLDALEIENTPSLQSMEGLGGVDKIQKRLYFEKVPALPACQIQSLVDRVATSSTDIRIDGANSSDGANCVTTQTSG